MRKFMNIFAAALVMLAAASCEKNETLPDNNSEGKVVTLKASINNGETRTSLGAKVDDIYPVLWSAWDAISVIQGSSSYTFVLSEEGAGKTSGTFMYPSEQAPNFNPEENYTAFYPASSVTVDNGTVKYNIPGTQMYAKNSFSSGAMPMAASSTGGTTFIFNNLFGVLKLQLKGATAEKVTSIVITSSNALNGEAQLVSGAIKLLVETAEYKKVTLDCSADGGVALNQGTATDFHIALPAGAESGLSLMIHTDKASYYKQMPVDDKNKVVAGSILKMPVLNTADMAPAYIENGICYGGGIALPKSADGTETIIWAPVNCGYDANHKYGLLYQWGRKYGQGFNTTETPNLTISDGDGPVTLVVGQNPEKAHIFYKIENSPYDWCSEFNDILWNSNTEVAPTKTDYDPCPEGWRVPTNTELLSLVNGKRQWKTGSDDSNHSGMNGYWFYGNTTKATGNKVFFPAAGYRGSNGGVGTRGQGYHNYWSSSSYVKEDGAHYSMMLQFSNYSVSSYDNSRAYGQSVRCVKDMSQSQPMPASN